MSEDRAAKIDRAIQIIQNRELGGNHYFGEVDRYTDPQQVQTNGPCCAIGALVLENETLRTKYLAEMSYHNDRNICALPSVKDLSADLGSIYGLEYEDLAFLQDTNDVHEDPAVRKELVVSLLNRLKGKSIQDIKREDFPYLYGDEDWGNE